MEKASARLDHRRSPPSSRRKAISRASLTPTQGAPPRSGVHGMLPRSRPVVGDHDSGSRGKKRRGPGVISVGRIHAPRPREVGAVRGGAARCAKMRGNRTRSAGDGRDEHRAGRRRPSPGLPRSGSKRDVVGTRRFIGPSISRELRDHLGDEHGYEIASSSEISSRRRTPSDCGRLAIKAMAIAKWIAEVRLGAEHVDDGLCPRTRSS